MCIHILWLFCLVECNQIKDNIMAILKCPIENYSNYFFYSKSIYVIKKKKYKINLNFMNLNSFIEEMRLIQESILKFINEESDMEENYQNLINNFESKKIIEDRNQFKSLLYLLYGIFKNHNRSSTFINKFEQIFQFLKDRITETFTNSEIFDIFKNDKRILLILFESKIIDIKIFYNRNKLVALL